MKAKEFLEKVAPDTLAEIYKNQQKKLDELIKQSEAEIKQQANKCGIVKKIKDSFALAGGIFAIMGALFTFVVFGGSIAEMKNNQDADKIYQGWLDSEDAIVLVEQLSNEYLEQYKVGEITYEQYREKMNGIGNTEACTSMSNFQQQDFLLAVSILKIKQFGVQMIKNWRMNKLWQKRKKEF